MVYNLVPRLNGILKYLPSMSDRAMVVKRYDL